MPDVIFEISDTFPSDKKSIAFIEPLINKLKQKVHLPLEKYYNILITVTEAVNNAIIHGNECLPSKVVKFNLIVYSDKITITVTDEGAGFNPEELLDPTLPDNLLRENGRGVFLIKELSDKSFIKSSATGTEIKMEFYLDEKED